MNEPVNKQLDEMLVEFFNQAEEDAHSDNFKDGVLITESHTKAKQSILDLIASEKVKELEQLWNKTQPDIIPEGTPPLPIDGQIILDRIKELKENQDVSK